MKLSALTSAPPPSRPWWWRTARSPGRTTSATTRARPRRSSSSWTGWRPRPASCPGRDRVFFTGSGAGFIAPLVGGKLIQEVVAVAACVERLHPDVRFVSEIGGEDMKTIFFTPTGSGSPSRSSCNRPAAAAPARSSRRPRASCRCPPSSSPHALRGNGLHKVSSKCGIFAETDANTLVKTGVPVEEIIASLFEAVVYQNLATLTKGNTPMPEVLLLGGPNLFFQGLQEAWRHHLTKLWSQRKTALPDGRDPPSLIVVPAEALYYACLGCVEIGKAEAPEVGDLPGTRQARSGGSRGPARAEGQGRRQGPGRRCGRSRHASCAQWDAVPRDGQPRHAGAARDAGPVLLGCDFGSTTAKAVVLSPSRELLFSCYALSQG